MVANASESDLRQHAVAAGMKTLAHSALEKVKSGITTLDEMYRVVETEEDFGTACPSCRQSLEPGFIRCPECGYSLHSVCPACRKMVSPDWKFCPYCRHDFLKPASGRSFA